MYCILVLQDTWNDPVGEDKIEVSRLGKVFHWGVLACFLLMYHSSGTFMVSQIMRAGAIRAKKLDGCEGFNYPTEELSKKQQKAIFLHVQKTWESFRASDAESHFQKGFFPHVKNGEMPLFVVVLSYPLLSLCCVVSQGIESVVSSVTTEKNKKRVVVTVSCSKDTGNLEGQDVGSQSPATVKVKTEALGRSMNVPAPSANIPPLLPLVPVVAIEEEICSGTKRKVTFSFVGELGHI